MAERSNTGDPVIDAFLNFEDYKIKMPKRFNTVPSVQPVRMQTCERDRQGTEYSLQFVREVESALSQVSLIFLEFFKQIIKISLTLIIFQNFSTLVLNATPLQSADLTAISAPTIHSETLDCSVKTQSSFNPDQHRIDLPIFESRDEIIQSIISSPVVIITGQTGCGKVSH